MVDAAVILEAGWTNGIDRLIFVEAPRDVRLLRVQGRGWDEKELLKREANQMHLEEKKRLADVVLVNDNGLEKVSEQVERLLRSWCLTT
ncbi:MAG: dephospho-CoA kinase [Gemmataceae bacterium]